MSQVRLWIPLFISAFRRAYELSYAMTCRCYTGGEGRTRMKQMKMKVSDFASILVFIAGIVAVVLLNKYIGVAVI